MSLKTAGRQEFQAVVFSCTRLRYTQCYQWFVTILENAAFSRCNSLQLTTTEKVAQKWPRKL